jgi:hypothetical protein
MTTGHSLSEEITRLRKRPKKTSANAAITWPAFNGQPKKEMSIPVLIDMYNHFMGGVDIANSLRATATTHFNRCQKEFFPGIFFYIDLVTINSKISF